MAENTGKDCAGQCKSTKGSHRHVSAHEKSWRTYSKSLIVELKEKLAERRARTLGLLSEGGDLRAFQEVDTESDGLDDTSSQSQVSTPHDGREEIMSHDIPWENGGETASLSDTSSLSDMEFCQQASEIPDPHPPTSTAPQQNVIRDKRRLCTTTTTECFSFSPPRSDNTTMTSAKFQFVGMSDTVSVGVECRSLTQLPDITIDTPDREPDTTCILHSSSPKRMGKQNGGSRDFEECEKTQEKETVFVVSDIPTLDTMLTISDTSPTRSRTCLSKAHIDRGSKQENDFSGLDLSPDSKATPKALQHLSEERSPNRCKRTLEGGTSGFSDANTGFDVIKPLTAKTISLSGEASKLMSKDYMVKSLASQISKLENSASEQACDIPDKPELQENELESTCVAHANQTKLKSILKDTTIAEDSYYSDERKISQDPVNVYRHGILGAGDCTPIDLENKELTHPSVSKRLNLMLQADELLKAELSLTTYECVLEEILRTVKSDTVFCLSLDKSTMQLLENLLHQRPMFHGGDQNVSSNSSENKDGGQPTNNATLRASNIANFQRNQCLQACLKKARLVGALQTNHDSAATKMGKIVTKQAYERAVREFESLVTRFVTNHASKGKNDEVPCNKNIDEEPKVTTLPPYHAQRKALSSKTFVISEKTPHESAENDDIPCSKSSTRSDTFIMDCKQNESFSKGEGGNTATSSLCVDDNSLENNPGCSDFQESHSRIIKQKPPYSKHKTALKNNQAPKEIKASAPVASQAEESEGESVESQESGFWSNQRYTSSLLTQLLDYSSQEEDSVDLAYAYEDGYMEVKKLETGETGPLESTPLPVMIQPPLMASPVREGRPTNHCALQNCDGLLTPTPTQDATDGDQRNQNGGSTEVISETPQNQREGETTCNEQSTVVKEKNVHASEFENDSELESLSDTQETGSAARENNADYIVSQENVMEGTSQQKAQGLSHHYVPTNAFSTEDTIIPDPETSFTKQIHTDLFTIGVAPESTTSSLQAHGNEPEEARSDQPYNASTGSISCDRGPSQLCKAQDGAGPSKTQGESQTSGNSVSAMKRNRHLLPRVDWSSSDDESPDDGSSDLSPAEILRHRQMEQLDGQLRHLKEIAKRKRKSRSAHKQSSPKKNKVECCSNAFERREDDDHNESRCPRGNDSVKAVEHSSNTDMHTEVLAPSSSLPSNIRKEEGKSVGSLEPTYTTINDRIALSTGGNQLSEEKGGYRNYCCENVVREFQSEDFNRTIEVAQCFPSTETPSAHSWRADEIVSANSSSRHSESDLMDTSKHRTTGCWWYQNNPPTQEKELLISEAKQSLPADSPYDSSAGDRGSKETAPFYDQTSPVFKSTYESSICHADSSSIIYDNAKTSYNFDSECKQRSYLGYLSCEADRTKSNDLRAELISGESKDENMKSVSTLKPEGAKHIDNVSTISNVEVSFDKHNGRDWADPLSCKALDDDMPLDRHDVVTKHLSDVYSFPVNDDASQRSIRSRFKLQAENNVLAEEGIELRCDSTISSPTSYRFLEKVEKNDDTKSFNGESLCGVKESTSNGDALWESIHEDTKMLMATTSCFRKDIEEDGGSKNIRDGIATIPDKSCQSVVKEEDFEIGPSLREALHDSEKASLRKFEATDYLLYPMDTPELPSFHHQKTNFETPTPHGLVCTTNELGMPNIALNYKEHVCVQTDETSASIVEDCTTDTMYTTVCSLGIKPHNQEQIVTHCANTKNSDREIAINSLLTKMESIERLLSESMEKQEKNATQEMDNITTDHKPIQDSRCVVENVRDCSVYSSQNPSFMVGQIQDGGSGVAACIANKSFVSSDQSFPESSEHPLEQGRRQTKLLDVATQVTEVNAQACQTDDVIIGDDVKTCDSVMQSVEDKFANLREELDALRRTVGEKIKEAAGASISTQTSTLNEFEKRVASLNKETAEEAQRFQADLIGQIQNLRENVLASLKESSQHLKDDILRDMQKELFENVHKIQTEIIDSFGKMQREFITSLKSVQEAIATQSKEKDTTTLSMERLKSLVDELKPPNDSKGMDVDTMKMRIMELTSQRDSEKVFHKITRESLRALERDHERLRDEYFGARLRRDRRLNETGPRRNLKTFMSQQCAYCFNNNSFLHSSNPTEKTPAVDKRTDGTSPVSDSAPGDDKNAEGGVEQGCSQSDQTQ